MNISIKSDFKKLIAILLMMLVPNTMIAIDRGDDSKEKVRKVFISKIVDHPALDATLRGIVDRLDEKGYKRGRNLEVRVESAQGNIALASQIAAKFAGQKPDLVIALGTVSAQSFLKYVKHKQIKLVFSSVTDPVQAGLKMGNITGVSNFIDIKPQLEMFKKVQPKLKKLGILYNPGEANSVNIVKLLSTLCSQLQISLIKQTINKTADVSQAAVKLAHSVDAIFISNDNTALAALQTIVNVANNAKIPVYVSDIDAVKSGALLALGPNQYQIGEQTGDIVNRILNGEDLNKIPFEFPKKTELYLNKDAARKLGIEIPEVLLKQASEVIDEHGKHEQDEKQLKKRE